MNLTNEFSLIPSAIILTLTIVIIALILENSKKKTEIKKSHLTIKQVKQKWDESSIIWQKSDLEKDNVIKDLKYQIQTKWDLGQVYKQECQESKEAIEHLEKLIIQKDLAIDDLMKLNKSLFEANEAWKNKANNLRCELHNETNELKQIIDEYSLFILNHCE